MPNLELTNAELELLKECVDNCGGSNNGARGMGNLSVNANRTNALVAISEKLDAAGGNSGAVGGEMNGEGGGRRRKGSRKGRKGKKGKKSRKASRKNRK
jgi:hypothetical protein